MWMLVACLVPTARPSKGSISGSLIPVCQAMKL
jgi:hypothetical protein